jgi:hypothetical protein
MLFINNNLKRERKLEPKTKIKFCGSKNFIYFKKKIFLC